jgi:RNA polymerase sigma factor (sigma-70 family)
MQKSAPTIDDFQQFMEKLKAGDGEAWEILCFVLKRLITYWLMSKGRLYREAQSIYHEAFTTFYEIFPTCEFEDFHKLKSCILSITDKKLKEYFRQQQKEQRFINIEDSYRENNSTSAFLRSEEIEHVERKLYIKSIILTLKEQEKDILYSYYYYGEKLKEIAKRLGTTEENCRIIKFRALKKLKRIVLEMD